MNLLPASASITSHSNIADLFTKPLPRHRFDTLIGDTTTITPSTSVATTVVDSASTVVASAPTATTVSDSVPTAPTLPIVLDTGASYSRAPSASDFLPVGHASYGLFRSPISVVSKALASTPVDPYTLITGEDVSVSFDSDPIDLSSTDPTLASDSVESFEFGTASLTFIYSNLDLIKVFVTPTQVDWLHWIPLPRLTLTESYRHIFGLDYLQAFALFHLIPIWIYYLLHFAVNLED